MIRRKSGIDDFYESCAFFRQENEFIGRYLAFVA